MCGFHFITFALGAFGSTISTSPLFAPFLFVTFAQIKPPMMKSTMTPKGTPMPIEACVVSFDIVGRWREEEEAVIDAGRWWEWEQYVAVARGGPGGSKVCSGARAMEEFAVSRSTEAGFL